VNARTLLLRIVVFGALFAAGVFAFNYVVMPMLVHQRGAVIVPDLRNTSEAQATQDLARLGLSLRVERSDYDLQVPAGYVVTQAPRANGTLKPGRSVSVVLSLGPRTHRVPELKGMSMRQARSVLEHAGLGLGRVARVARPGLEHEEVVAASPPVGEEAREGEAVDVVLSVPGGGRVYMMPDLSTQDLFFVRQRLERLGFRVSSVRYEAREGVFPNTVVDQRPRPGTRIREGDSIELVAASSR
jgi:eukaryotic-like serine/threonine-protein kinase